jgi:ERO1-like protein beta
MPTPSQWQHRGPKHPVPMSALSVLPFLSFAVFVLTHASQIEPNAMVSDACASYSTLDSLNAQLKYDLDSITKETDFFAYYRLNLFNKECPFWNDANGMCGNIACAVNTLDNEEDIPMIWRAKELGRLEGPKAEHPGKQLQEERGPEKPLQGELGEDVGESCVVEYDDECDERDYCVPEDESATGKGDYVSLVDNPERFTGYSGEGAHMVWDAIYRENCFSRASFPDSASLGMPLSPFSPAANDLRSVIQNSGELDHPELEDECLEKRVFYRVISGMHASISMHLCHDYLNQSTGLWAPNLQCYIDRLHTHPERISNLYFNYALVLRAVAKVGPYLQNYTFCSGDAAQDRDTKDKLQTLTMKAARAPQIFDESLMFVNGEGVYLKEDFRNRFRNVSRLMDCVGCDKCRLWGKVQTAGYGTALKVLFEFGKGREEEEPHLKRTELVALLNTLARISNSLTAIGEFRNMLEAQESQKEPLGAIADTIPVPERFEKGKSWMAPKPKPLAPPAPVEEEDDEEEDLEEFNRIILPRHGNETVSEAFFAELDLVYRAVKFIIKSWIKFPYVCVRIIFLETVRAWEWFIGLRVSPRSWSIGMPRHDEI